MDGGLVAAIVVAVLGTGGIGAAIAAWRKSIPEAENIGVGTQERIFAMANDMLDSVRKEREKCLQQLANHEARIRDLEKRLREHGLPYNGT
jgi:threonine dehydrogenase-like Zn-dependent dehydrogenase